MNKKKGNVLGVKFLTGGMSGDAHYYITEFGRTCLQGL